MSGVTEMSASGNPGTTPPAEVVPTPVDGVEVLGALSPSRAGDFLTCPLLFRYRTIDRLPEALSRDAVRGTLAHRVLEGLFDLPAADRTPQRARELVGPAWQDLVETEPEVGELLGDDDFPGWLESCGAVLDRYFTLEDPRRLEPAEREAYVEVVLDSRLLLRGIIDRIDVSPDGLVRVVDYKTGRSPGLGFEAKAFFQMRFYALVLWRTRDVVPAMLQLVYLGNGEVLRYVPDEDDLRATERKIEAVWSAIQRARDDADWRPRKSAMCGWCSFQAQCPEYGGTPPPLPDRELTSPANG